MKPSKLFVSLDDFSNRFKDTFIYYKGIPKFVQSCTMVKTSDPETYCFNAFDFKKQYEPERKSELIYLNDEYVNFRQYNIGYVQYHELGAMWCSRVPSRQWKQGLRKDQCQFVGYSNDESYTLMGPNTYTYNMLMNIYQPWEKVLETIKQSPSGAKIPIHKNFAIYNGRTTKWIGVEYKGISISAPNSDSPVIFDNYRYLLKIPEYSKLLSGLVANA